MIPDHDAQVKVTPPDLAKRRTGTVDRGPDGRIQPFKKTQQQCHDVEALAALGTPHADLVLLIEWGRGGPISEKTLRRHFRVELARGKARATARVARKVFEQAVEGHFGSQMFWLKCQAGWKETAVVANTGPNGQPLPTQPIFYLPSKDPPPGHVEPRALSAPADRANTRRSLPPPATPSRQDSPADALTPPA